MAEPLDDAGEYEGVVNPSLVNAEDNLVPKSELQSAQECAKFLEELNEESRQFFVDADQKEKLDHERRQLQRLEEDLKQLLSYEEEGGEDISEEEMPNRWRSLNDLSDGLPASLIITSLPTSLFVAEEVRAEFESIFTAYDTEATFQYFRSFRRCRVNFTSSLKATLARLHCNELEFHGSMIRCFFAQIIEQRPADDENRLLKLPELEKQFLISPPASPPVGWEQSRESEPIISFDLFSRLTALAGGGGGGGGNAPMEVQPRIDSCPAIVVHTCGDDMETPVTKPKIPQTRRPEPVVTK